MSFIRALGFLPSFLALAATGCTPTDPGEPGTVSLQVDDITVFSTATLPLDTVTAARCDGTQATFVEVDTTIDLLADQEPILSLSGGTYCSLSLVMMPDTPTQFAGTTAGGTAFELSVTLETLTFSGEFPIDGNNQNLLLAASASLPVSALEGNGATSVHGTADPLSEQLAIDLQGAFSVAN